MNVLSDIMFWIFCIGSALIMIIDIILGIARRPTFSHLAKWVIPDFPTLAYLMGVLPGHFFENHPIVSAEWGVVITLGVGGAVAAYRLTGRLMRPTFAFLIGLPVGAFIFVN